MIKLDLAALQQRRRLEPVQRLDRDLVRRPVRGGRPGIRPVRGATPPAPPPIPQSTERQGEHEPRPQEEPVARDRARPLHVADVPALVESDRGHADDDRVGGNGGCPVASIREFQSKGRDLEFPEFERGHVKHRGGSGAVRRGFGRARFERQRLEGAQREGIGPAHREIRRMLDGEPQREWIAHVNLRRVGLDRDARRLPPELPDRSDRCQSPARQQEAHDRGAPVPIPRSAIHMRRPRSSKKRISGRR